MRKLLLLLLVCISSSMLFAQTYFHPHEGVGEMPMDGKCVIRIDGQEELFEFYELGVFLKDNPNECRGTARVEMEYTYILFGHYEYEIPAIYGEDGEVMTFRLYDHQHGIELDLTTEQSFTFVSNGELGTYEEPYFVDFTTPTPPTPPTQTFELPITGFGTNLEPGNYKLISSPIGAVSTEDVGSLMSNNYDLYWFNQAGDDEGKEWINMHDGGTLEVGKGYLYANSENVTLTFTGTPYTGEATFPLDYSDANQNEDMRGWNLVGNPFGTTATINFDEFYVMNEGGTNLIESSGQIDIMQGVFVKATASGQNVVFTAGGSTDGGEKIVLNVLKDRGNAIDRAVVRLAGNSTLPKFMLNPEATKIYIEQGGDDYAVVSSNEDEIPVSFKAASNGTYTLNVAVQNAEMDYLHLVDNLAGTDTDLLANPNYTFEANTGDYASRFTLVLRNTTGLEEHFAFFNGHNWTVSNQGEATLQVIDVTGRLVSTKTIDGTTQLDVNAAPGVYMFRLVNGNDVKVQKVVVR